MAQALLVIDVQRALVDELTPARRGEFLSTLGEIIKRARAAAVPVVYVRHDGGPGDSLAEGTAGWEIAGEIAPEPGEPVVDKRFRDAFRETNLASLLAGIGADHLIASGMQTEFCVDATIREAERRGYRVTLVADAHATFDAGGASEAQIRDQVHRVVRGTVAAIVPSAELFAGEATVRG